MLTIQDLSKKYNGNFVIDGVSFAINSGETIGLLGPNGSGKSTLLNLILGTILPTSGTIDCDRKRLGASVARTGFINDMTARHNIELFLALSGQSKARLEIVSTKLKMDFLSKNVSRLSVGMKQKLSLAIALLDLKDLILLDEPFTHLDQTSMVELKQIIEIETGLKRSFIITSHTYEHLDVLCDRFLFLDRGKIVANIATSDLLDEYGSIEAAFKSLLSC